MDIAIVGMIIFGMVCFFSVTTRLFRKSEPTKEQRECNHEWHRLNSSHKSTYFSIYCPKCKLEKLVSEETWHKIQIDIEYEKEKK